MLVEHHCDRLTVRGQVTVIFASTEKMAALVKPLESLKGRVRMVVYWGPGHVHAVKARPEPPAWAGSALDANHQASCVHHAAGAGA